jgi:DNA-binding SARP family transcriptional activator
MTAATRLAAWFRRGLKTFAASAGETDPAAAAGPLVRTAMQLHVQGDAIAGGRRQATAQPVLICLLGSFQVIRHGRPVVLRGGGKAEALLSMLALRPRQGVTRERLIELLWPDADATLAGQSLNTLVYSLHRMLGDDLDGAPPVVTRGGWYHLNLNAGVGVDLTLFEELANAGERLQRRGDALAAASAYQQALDLYRGDLCGGTDVHSLVERERVRARYLNMLAQLADYHFVARDYDACLAAVLRLLAVDACREDAHRLAMRCYVRRGERAQALRQYRLCAAILSAEFDVAPETATQALFEQVRFEPEGI